MVNIYGEIPYCTDLDYELLRNTIKIAEKVYSSAVSLAKLQTLFVRPFEHKHGFFAVLSIIDFHR